MLPLITYQNLHEMLHTLFEHMIQLSRGMTSVASGIAGIGALLYISYRVWQSIARAEPLDIFPLLRPFAVGICILFFDTLVVGGINGIMSPVVKSAHQLLSGQTFDMQEHQKTKDELALSQNQIWDTLCSAESSEELEQMMEEFGVDGGDLAALQQMYYEGSSWSLKGLFTKIMRWLLEMLFEFSSLVIDTIRTFYLIVLVILGPLAFAVSVFDGFQSSLTNWISKYVSVYLWLPISDIFGAVLARLQVLSLQRDVEMLASDPFASFSADNAVYLVFLFIGICGYFTIPSIASWIVQATGFGNYNRTVITASSSVMNFVAGVTGAALGNAWGRTRELMQRLGKKPDK